MGRKIVRFFVTIFILILLISAITFGVLFYVKNNEVVTATQRNEVLSSELAVSKQKVTELESTCTGECPTKLQFVDQEQEIEFTYPISWKVEVSTTIGEGIDAGLGRLLTSYQIIASKGEAKLIYDRVLFSGGFVGTPGSTKDEFKVLTDDMARVRKSGSSDWSYVGYTACTGESDEESDYCYSSLSNGFGEGLKIVTLKGITSANQELLEEADAIVLSAQ